jgi:hypothetical protein
MTSRWYIWMSYWQPFYAVNDWLFYTDQPVHLWMLRILEEPSIVYKSVVVRGTNVARHPEYHAPGIANYEQRDFGSTLRHWFRIPKAPNGAPQTIVLRESRVHVPGAPTSPIIRIKVPPITDQLSTPGFGGTIFPNGIPVVDGSVVIVQEFAPAFTKYIEMITLDMIPSSGLRQQPRLELGLLSGGPETFVPDHVVNKQWYQGDPRRRFFDLHTRYRIDPFKRHAFRLTNNSPHSSLWLPGISTNGVAGADAPWVSTDYGATFHRINALAKSLWFQMWEVHGHLVDWFDTDNPG